MKADLRPIAHARQAERRRLARDLHDGLGQSLVVLQMNLRLVRESLTDEDPAAELLDESLALLSGLHRDVRGRALALHSSVLDDLGLAPALRSHVVQLTRATRAAIGFEWTGAAIKERWSKRVETCAFRIAQEALTNAMRHAKADAIAVAVVQEQGSLIVRIHDDGIGFDSTEDRAQIGRRSLGLVSMTERARLAGGFLTITSSHGQGTTVTLRFERKTLLLRSPTA